MNGMIGAVLVVVVGGRRGAPPSIGPTTPGCYCSKVPGSLILPATAAIDSANRFDVDRTDIERIAFDESSVQVVDWTDTTELSLATAAPIDFCCCIRESNPLGSLALDLAY
jgi:hypothetical protein